MANASRDENRITTLIAASSTDGSTPIRVYADPITHRLLVDLAGSTGTVTSITQGTGILLTPSPIITTGSIALSAPLQPIATLGSAFQSIRVNAGATALEYYTPAAAGITIGTTTITSGTTTRILYDNAGVVGEYTITGTGTVVAMQTSPTLITPVLGVATATSINKVAITAPATSATLTIADGKTVTHNATTTFAGTDSKTLTISNSGTLAGGDAFVLAIAAGKTLTASNSLTFAGTDSTVLTFPTTSATIARTDTGQTFTGTNAFGVITATTLNGNTFTTGTYTLTGTAGKTLNFTNSLTLSGTDSTVMTFPSTSATIARTDAANTFTGIQTFSTPIATASVATMTATVGGGVPTPPNNTTTFLRGDGTFAAPTASVTPAIVVSTDFETAARFASTLVSGGTTTFDGNALGIATSATTTSSSQTLWRVTDNQDTGIMYKGSPTFSAVMLQATTPSTASMFIGLGPITVSGSGHTYTDRHIGFKILAVASVLSLYATQGDNTTENASSALTTVTANDQLDLIFKVNGTSSVDYYWRKNGGALSSATNLTSNMPSGVGFQAAFSVSNNSTATNNSVRLFGASYTR